MCYHYMFNMFECNILFHIICTMTSFTHIMKDSLAGTSNLSGERVIKGEQQDCHSLILTVLGAMDHYSGLLVQTERRCLGKICGQTLNVSLTETWMYMYSPFLNCISYIFLWSIVHNTSKTHQQEHKTYIVLYIEK